MCLLVKIQARIRGYLCRLKHQDLLAYRTVGMAVQRYAEEAHLDPQAIDYENERVQQIHHQLGSFNYSASRPTGLNISLELRSMHTLENHAKYEG